MNSTILPEVCIQPCILTQNNFMAHHWTLFCNYYVVVVVVYSSGMMKSAALDFEKCRSQHWPISYLLIKTWSSKKAYLIIIVQMFRDCFRCWWMYHSTTFSLYIPTTQKHTKHTPAPVDSLTTCPSAALLFSCKLLAIAINCCNFQVIKVD